MLQAPNNSMQDATSRLLAFWEILSVVISCLIAEWVILSFADDSKLIGIIPVLLALAFMIFSHRERGETIADLGFRFDNFVSCARLLIGPTLIAGALILFLSWLTRGERLELAPLRMKFLSLPLWALFQQYALQGFINRRAQLAVGPGAKSVVLVAVVFSFLHLPNPLLTVLTLVGALLWAAVYQREPNLFALALSHAFASLLLALSLPPHLINNLRVGFKYFR